MTKVVKIVTDLLICPLQKAAGLLQNRPLALRMI